MSLLSSLIEQGKSLLGKTPPEPTATDAIVHDSFDAADWQSLQKEAPAVKKLVKELGTDLDYAEDLSRDFFMGLLQGDPTVRTEGLKPSHEPHAAVMQQWLDLPETAQLRTVTMHDRYDAAMGLMSCEPVIRETLVRVKETREQIQQSLEAAQQAQQQAQQQLQQAVQQAEQVANDPNATPEQQQAAEDGLQQGAGALGAAQGAAQQAQQQAQAQAQGAATALRQNMRQAAKQATQERDDEQQLMRGYGVDDGQLQRMDFKERQKLATRLAGSRLAKFSALLGAFKTMAQTERKRKIQHQQSEIFSVKLSGDFSKMVPSELVNLSMDETEDDFYRRLTEGQLLTYNMRGNEKLGKGPVIAVVDCSGSMSCADVQGGTREAWAKALTLALLDQARSGKRDFHCILFSSQRQQKHFAFPGGVSTLDQVLEMTEHFYAGGTHYETPLLQAVEIIDQQYLEHGKSKADITLITDDSCYVGEDFLHRWLEVKKKADFRCFGIAIGGDFYGDDGASSLLAISDNVRTITEMASDPSAVADIFRAV